VIAPEESLARRRRDGRLRKGGKVTFHNGSFPLAGPVPYLTDDEEEARAALMGPRPTMRKWFHATDERAASIAVRQGLTPSCWRGSDCCAVCGHADRANVHLHQGPWVLEIVSPCLEGEIKAWWVPPSSIRGGWRDGEFVPAAEIRRHTFAARSNDHVRPCNCGLSHLVDAEIAAWRRQITT